MNIIKKINGVSKVKNFFSDTSKGQVQDNILDLFQNFMVCKKIQDLGKIKKKGFEGINILTTLLIFPFAGIASIRALFLSGLYNSDAGEKDVRNLSQRIVFLFKANKLHISLDIEYFFN